MATNILKLLLAILSAILVSIQVEQKNNKMIFYWVLVMLYWIANFIQGLI